MKYGIKHDNGAIQAVSRFPNDVVPAEFKEIKKAEYDDFLTKILSASNITYNEVDNVIEVDQAAEDALTAEKKQIAIRAKLRKMGIELSLMQRLNEGTAALQTEFDDLADIYKGT